MTTRDIVVIGGSAGAIQELLYLAPRLPPDFPAAILIVVHVPPDGPSALPRLLHRAGALPAMHAEDGMKPVPGRIFVAPPDQHLLIRGNSISCGDGPRENRHRPAIDPLFRTAARAYGNRVVGVLLSGNLDDGVAGLAEVKRRGGVAVVLDPAEALYDGIPANAVATVRDIDYITPLAGLPGLLVRLASEQITMTGKPRNFEPDPAEHGAPDAADVEQAGTPSGFSCPDCGGVLWELHEGELLRYRCRTGHAYSPESLLSGQSQAVEDALWAAIRVLSEASAQARTLARRMRDRGLGQAADRFILQADDAEHRAAVIRETLVGFNQREAAELEQAG